MKTVIYLDVLLLTNFLAAYFLLLATAAFSGLRTRFGRLVLGSLVAALSSLILFVPEQPYPVQLLYKIATALLITAVAFGCSNKLRLLTAACWYAALNIALAGLVLLVILHTGTKILQTGNLTVYLRISPLLLVVLSVCAAWPSKSPFDFWSKENLPRKPLDWSWSWRICSSICAPHWIPAAT